MRISLRSLASFGVALVIMPALKGSKIDGAVMPSDDDGFAVGLSLRGQRFDSSVFTLAHELAHIVLGHVGGERALVDEALADEATDEVERAADEHAARWLFPEEPRLSKPISKAAVLKEAARRGCHPALVVGRLQWRCDLDWKHLRREIPSMRYVLGPTTLGSSLTAKPAKEAPSLA